MMNCMMMEFWKPARLIATYFDFLFASSSSSMDVLKIKNI